jgi:hypothetical protein
VASKSHCCFVFELFDVQTVPIPDYPSNLQYIKFMSVILEKSKWAKQKELVICVSRPKSASFSPGSEFSGGGARSASEKARPKKSYFSSACEYVKLPFSLSEIYFR